MEIQMEPFKNIYNEKEIIKLSSEIQKVYPGFQKTQFVNSLINETWEQKELKERIRAISTSLGEFLDQDYSKALDILKQIHTQFDGLFHLIFPDFVEVFGLEHFEISIEALKVFTPQCSSEFAVRPFLIKYPQCIEVFKEWAKDENEHVRRLASEGCRPRLPWGIALAEYKKDPKKVLEILEILKNDASEYVQKSVANNLNDISKDNPDIVKKILKQWYGNSNKTDWIVKHASRTFLKAGDSEVLNLFGYSAKDIKVAQFECNKRINLNDYLNFSFQISSKKPLGKLRLEYKLGLLRQKGKINYKVFKISERDVKDKKLTIEKSHHFKEVTTRKYYKGIHSLTIIVNGKEFDTKEFELKINDFLI
jgi:3-methyladenine DNA glycosylase AlkC